MTLCGLIELTEVNGVKSSAGFCTIFDKDFTKCLSLFTLAAWHSVGKKTETEKWRRSVPLQKLGRNCLSLSYRFRVPCIATVRVQAYRRHVGALHLFM